MPYKRKEIIGDCTLYLGDCLEIMPTLGKVDAVVTDPPYPNNANHFIDGIEKALAFIKLYSCPEWLVFWNEREIPPVEHCLVAVHVWFRTNSNRPDNYESVFHFNENGDNRASRVFPYAVICEGLTGCYEATGHPTQKNRKLMEDMLRKTTKAKTILDPFMGSGTTGVACINLGRKFIGIELEEKYFDIACKRIDQANRQGKLFQPPKPKPEQSSLLAYDT